MTTQFTDRELYLLRVCERFLLEIFQHDDAKVDANLAENMIEHAFSDVEAAGYLAENELAADLAGSFCRRATHLRAKGVELTEFLGCTNLEELEALSTVKSMHYREELRAKHGSTLAPAARVEAAS